MCYKVSSARKKIQLSIQIKVFDIFKNQSNLKKYAYTALVYQ